MATPCETSTLTIPARPPYAEVASVYVEAVAGAVRRWRDQTRQLAQSLLVIVQEILSQAFEPGEAQAVQISCQRLPVGLKVIIGEKGLPLSEAELASLAVDARTCPSLRLGETISPVCASPGTRLLFIIWDEPVAAVELVKYFPSGSESPAGLSGRTFSQAARALSAATSKPLPFGPSAPRMPRRSSVSCIGPMAIPIPLSLSTTRNGSSPSTPTVASSHWWPSRPRSDGRTCGDVFSPENPTLAEIGAAVVHPDFRGHGCLRQLTEYALSRGPTAATAGPVHARR